MDAQMAFFADDEDLALLLEHAARCGLLALFDETSPDTPPIWRAPTQLQLGRDRRMFYLSPIKSPTEGLAYRFATSGERRSIDPIESPVIEVRPSPRRRDELGTGCIRIASADPTARRSYASLARLLRSWPRTDRLPLRVGPHTSELARRHALRLVRDGIELHVADHPERPARVAR